LVPAQAVDAWEAHGEPRFVACRALQSLECNFEHEALLGRKHNFTYRAEAFDGIAADETIDLNEFFIGEAEICLAHRHQYVAVLTLGPDTERVVGVVGRALAVTALRVHQHGIDHEGIAFPLPPRTSGTPGQIRCIPALEHDAFDRLGIRTCAGGGRISASGGEFVPRAERHQWREIDPRLMQTRDERFQPCPAFREGTLAQVFLAVYQEVVGAEMGGKFSQQLGVDALAIEPLLQDVETLHPAVAHDQQLAIDRSRQSQGFNQLREAPRYVLPSAGIEARYDLAVLVNAGHGLDANAVPFP